MVSMTSPRARSTLADSFRLGSSIATVAADAERRQRYVRLLRASTVFFSVLAIGAYGFWTLTGHQRSALECIYMTVITISTVGFEEVIPVDTDALKLFTMGTILFGGASIAYFLTAVAAVLVEGDLVHRVWRRRVLARLAAEHDHVLVCGLGLTGRRVYSELHDARVRAVAIDLQPERVELLLQAHGADVLFVVGDCFDEANLRAANIGSAHGLIAAFPDDRDNLLLSVTARQLNPALRIVVRLNTPENAYLFTDVASATVHTPALAGTRLANEAVRPELLAFIDALLAPDARGVALEELPIVRHAPLADRQLGETELSAKTRVIVVGHRLGATGPYTYHPGPTTRLGHGGTLLVLGDARARRAAHALVAAPPRRRLRLPWRRTSR